MTATDTTRAGMKKQAPPAAPAISPAIGPLPPISVPRPGEVGSTGLLWHATAQAARRAGAGPPVTCGNTTKHAGRDRSDRRNNDRYPR